MRRWRQGAWRFLWEEAGSQSAEHLLLTGVLGGGGLGTLTTLQRAADARLAQTAAAVADAAASIGEEACAQRGGGDRR
jgi:hypothetical protein